MSDFPAELLEARDRLERHGWDGQRIRQVYRAEAGYRNRVFVVQYDEQKLVVRLPGRASAPSKRSRKSYRREMHNLAAAAHAGVAPRPVLADSADGFLVMEYVAGTHPVRRKVSAAAAMRIARCLRLLHRETAAFVAGPDFLRRIRIRVERLVADPQSGRSHAHDLPDVATRLMPVLAALGDSTPPPAPCHGDLVLANIIDDGDRVFLIDWETSSVGDPHQDLGTVCLRARLAGEARAAFLNAYFEGESAEQVRLGSARVRLWEAARAMDKALIYWRNGCRTGEIDSRVRGWTRRCAGLLNDSETQDALRTLRSSPKSAKTHSG